MSNIIDKIQVSGVTYDIGGTGGGGNPTVELTQAEYEALVTAGTVSADTYYIITDAQAGDLTNYYTKTETNTLLGGKADTATTYTKTEVDNAITAATSTKQDTLVSGTNIKTINNESLLGSGNIDIQGGGGGGKAVTGGTNISVTTGETVDTVNCTLPLRVGSGYNSIYGGDLNNNSCDSQYGFAYGDNADCGNSGSYCMAFGSDVYANALYTFITGKGNTGTNNSQAAFGQFTVNNKANGTFGDSGNTLFSVGNGTSVNARHNAFEIRQNGDIYLSSGGTDIKLQDHLGGGGGGGKAIEAGTNISITTGETTDTINCTLPITTSNNNRCIITGIEGAKGSAEGMGTYESFITGRENKATNYAEAAFGQYNRSNYESNTFGNSGNTLFSVGNGTGTLTSARHNAFEIRQNGDIYCSDGTNDVKLQDYLQIKVVKLTQSAYDALSPNYDSNTLYVIVN